VRQRLDQVDLMKALAVLGVLVQHGLTPGTRRDMLSSLHADQAVPVFVVLTGLLLSRRVPGRAYLGRRLARLLVPFAVIWVAALVAGVLAGSVYLGAQTPLGALPVTGPGNYYVPVALQLALLVPFVTWAYRRAPRATLVACLAADAAFELAWANVGAIERTLGSASEFVYDASALRYLFALALGIWLADGTPPGRHRSRLLWLGVAVAVAYLVLEQALGAGFPLFEPGFERRTNFIVACFPALLVALGLRWLPAAAPRALAPAAQIGRASYHVFLVQIVWFGLLPAQSAPRFVAGLAASIALGLVFHRLVPGSWTPARAGLPSRGAGPRAVDLQRPLVAGPCDAAGSRRASYSESAGFGALGFVAMALLGIAGGIVVARVYGIEVIGEFALVMAPVNAVWYLSSARERPALVREIAALPARAPRVTALFAAVLAFSFALTTLVSALAVPVVAVLFDGPVGRPWLFVPAVVSLAGYLVITNTAWNLDAIFTGFRAARELFWIRLHQAAMFVAVAVSLGVVTGSVWGLIAATLASWVTSLGHRVVAIRAYMRFTVSRTELREGFRTLPELIRFGLKIVPGSLANGTANEVGTWVLGVTSSVAAVGAYNRAWTLARRFVDVNWRITEMLFPTLVERRRDGDRAGFDRALVDTMRYCAAGLLLPAAAGGGAAASVMALYGPGFGTAAPALAVLLAVPAVVTVAGVQRHALLALDRPGLSSVVALGKMAVTVAATIAGAAWLGIAGAALGLLTGACAEVAWLLILTARALDASLHALWPRREMAAIAIAYAAGFGAAHAVASALPGVAGLPAALAAGAAAYGLAFAAAGGLNARDRARAGALAAWLRRRWRAPTPLSPRA
jgi:O-antigen/teichoic acid export membrane protein/peptidoglycan/LPS O-acetylase OafA/YrhL